MENAGCGTGFWKTAVSWLLAIFVNTLLNLMDSVTYGRLIFPVHDPFFEEFAVPGVCMYLLCTAAAQVVISLLSSFRKGATACAMVENLPFYHAICMAIARRITNKTAAISTILASFFLISILTGLIFMVFALMNLDRVVHKFPRVVLVGSMGGIGVFLIVTGFEIAISQRFTLATMPYLFSSWSVFGLWSIGVATALVAMVAELRFALPFVTPVISGALLFIFYLLLPILPFSVKELRDLGWLVKVPDGKINFLEVYSMFSLEKVDLMSLASVMPIIVGAAFFGSLHVPINVPSFSRLTGQGFSMKRELLTQTASNFLTAFVGILPNYFVYTNSLLFLRAGGTHRAAGLLLALATALMLVYGLSVLGYIPTVIILFLVFYLGLCLIWEALIGSFPMCTWAEYLIIATTIVAIQIVGFIPGILLGVAAALLQALLYPRIFCAPKVSGRDRRVESVHSPAFEQLLHRAREYSLIIPFHGYLYFGNCVEELQKLTFTSLECRFVILDFREVCGVDLNICEGILSLATSGLLAEETVVCLGLKGPLHKLMACQEGGNLILANKDPGAWLCGYMDALVNDSHGLHSTEDTDLLLETGQSFSTLAQEIREYDQYKLVEERLISKMRELPSQYRTVLLHAGEPLSAQIPSATGVLIVQSGLVKKFPGVFERGAWIGLVEHVSGVQGLDGCMAETRTSAMHVSRVTLERLSLEDTPFRESLHLLAQMYAHSLCSGRLGSAPDT